MRTELLEKLLRGQFICSFSDPDAYRLLEDEDKRTEIDQVLANVNRRVARTSGVFYAAYVLLGGEERKRVRAQFAEISCALGPFIQWLVLAQEALGSEAPLGAGYTIRATELVQVSEDVPAIRDRLSLISQRKPFGCTSNTIEQQVRLTLQRMQQLGYLLQDSPERQIYCVSGKVDYLYEVVRLIDSVKDLRLEELAAPSEQGLLL
ncbi:hypothetical protein [Dolichospermum phage Dfl-JY45]